MITSKKINKVLEGFIFNTITGSDINKFFFSKAVKSGFTAISSGGGVVEKNFSCKRPVNQVFCKDYATTLNLNLEMQSFKVKPFYTSQQIGVSIYLKSAPSSNDVFLTVLVEDGGANEVSIVVVPAGHLTKEKLTTEQMETEAYTTIERFFNQFDKINKITLRQINA